MSKRYRFRVPAREDESPAAHAKRQRDWSYEESTVKHLLARFNMRELAQPLWSEHKNNSPEGFGRLSLSDFRKEIGFPVWLGARRISLSRQPSAAKLLRDFGYTPMFGAFREVCNGVPEDYKALPVCAIFPVPKTRFMALHTFESPLATDTTQVVIQNRSATRVFTMEPLSKLLEALEAADLLS
jgi:hypothetical protein